MISNTEFRQDLLYRINTIQIHIPPLRERLDDIEDLANHFLKIFGKNMVNLTWNSAQELLKG
ncbi:MAG: hypothetical protein HC830_12805 [Bacteroidetes bacterium]|nr:hypothetical protein [Bacteroidota bacterium]